MDYLPPLSATLIAELDKAIPVRCIAPGESLESAHRYAGKRELVDFLLRVQAEAAGDGPLSPAIPPR